MDVVNSILPNIWYQSIGRNFFFCFHFKLVQYFLCIFDDTQIFLSRFLCFSKFNTFLLDIPTTSASATAKKYCYWTVMQIKIYLDINSNRFNLFSLVKSKFYFCWIFMRIFYLCCRIFGKFWCILGENLFIFVCKKMVLNYWILSPVEEWKSFKIFRYFRTIGPFHGSAGYQVKYSLADPKENKNHSGTPLAKNNFISTHKKIWTQLHLILISQNPQEYVKIFPELHFSMIFKFTTWQNCR